VDIEGIPTLVLESAPTAFLALHDDPALATRITAVLDLITWPGKDD